MVPRVAEPFCGLASAARCSRQQGPSDLLQQERCHQNLLVYGRPRRKSREATDGKYILGKLEVTVSGGICRNSEGKLAGSTLTLDRALRNIVGLGVPFADAVRMLTLNPASLLGIEFKKGALRVGADADIVLLDEGLQLTNVWVRGAAVE